MHKMLKSFILSDMWLAKLSFCLWGIGGLSVAAVSAQNPFSVAERSHVRVTTPGLFGKSNRLELPLAAIADSACCFPLKGAKVISPFGGRRHHSGTDIKTKANDTIRAAFDGVVRMSKPYGAYGKVIVIRHFNGLETVYSHNVKNAVISGDTVKAGQYIALTGRTGRATTEHLHFEVRVNGQAINPAMVFDLKQHALKRHTLVFTRSGSYVKTTIKNETEKDNK